MLPWPKVLALNGLLKAADWVERKETQKVTLHRRVLDFAPGSTQPTRFRLMACSHFVRLIIFLLPGLLNLPVHRYFFKEAVAQLVVADGCGALMQ